MQRFLSKSLSKYIILLLVLLLAVICATVPSKPVSADSIIDTNIAYESVEKDIVVSSEKVCHITETITVNYQKPGINLGLRRNVSHANKITRVVDGKSYVTTTYSKLQLLSVLMDGQPEHHFVETTSDYFYINTGADGDYKSGQHVYTIEYLYDLGEDFINDFDDFTFDLMDYGFRGSVGHFAASVTLPQDIDISQLSFRTNHMTPIGGEGVSLQVEGNRFSCSLENLPAENGLTVQLILPQGYFNTYYAPSLLYYFIIATLILSAIIIIVMLILSHRKPKVIVTPEFYPPKDYSPIDVGKVYRAKVRSKDFASLIIYWADCGYITITPDGKKDFILTKLKDMPKIKTTDPFLREQKRLEKKYFDKMFDSNTEFKTKKKRVFTNIDLIEAANNIVKLKPKVKKRQIIVRFIMHILAILPMVLFISWKISMDGNFFYLFMILFPLIAMFIFTYSTVPIVFKCIWCAIFGGVPIAILAILGGAIYDIYFLFYPVAIFFILANYIPKYVGVYDSDTIEKLGAVLGFKNFLLTCEVEKMEALIEENPSYYFNILPYCYVFDITEKMEKKFKPLNLTYPDYCKGASFGTFAHTMSHSISSISGSSFGGGSGGGGGGGGGSSGGGGGGGGCGGR